MPDFYNNITPVHGIHPLRKIPYREIFGQTE